MNASELFLGYIGFRVLSDLFGDKKPSGPAAPPGTYQPTAPGDLRPAPARPIPTGPPIKPAKPAGLPPKPSDIKWPPRPLAKPAAPPAPKPAAPPGSPGGLPYGAPGAPPAGVPGAHATIDPSRPYVPPPGAKPPPPPPPVDEKAPTMQKGAPAVTSAAQRGIDAMKKKQQPEYTGTGSRQFRPKRKGLTSKEINRAKELLGGWQKPGQIWRSADDPSVQYRSAKHGTKKAIEVWTSNPDHW